MDPVSINNEFERRINEAFSLFDHQCNKTVDIREVGTILRYLGCAPTEQEINEVIVATELNNSSDTIHLSKFSPYMVQALGERRMQPVPPEKLLDAFMALDPENNGYICKDELSKLMLEEGEQFTKEELDEMLTAAVDPRTGNITYEHYLNQLMLFQNLFMKDG